jgi:hypothetical protein
MGQAGRVWVTKRGVGHLCAFVDGEPWCGCIWRGRTRMYKGDALRFVVAYVDYKIFYRTIFFPIIASDAEPVTVKLAA